MSRRRVSKTHAARSEDRTLCGRVLAIAVEESEATCIVCRLVATVRVARVDRQKKIRVELSLLEAELKNRRRDLVEKLARISFGQVRFMEKSIGLCVRKRDDLESELREIGWTE